MLRRATQLTAAATLAIALVCCGDSDDGGAPDGHDAASDARLADAALDADADDSADADSDDSVADGVADVSADTATPVTYGAACADGARVGRFDVGHFDLYAAVTGEVANGIIPLTVRQEVASEGPCRLLQKDNPFCATPCTGGDLCNHDGTCVPYPANLSVGQVTVTGLDTPISMAPNAVKTYAATDVPALPFEAGDPITVTAAGGDIPGFSLSAFGVPLLSIPDTNIALERDQPTTLTWVAEPGGWRLVFEISVDQHGNSPVSLVCEVEDTGSFTIPAALVTALLDYGVSGFATFELTRQTVDRELAVPGCIELRVLSFTQGKLSVAGHTPCTSTAQCPDGEVCDLAVNTCVPE